MDTWTAFNTGPAQEAFAVPPKEAIFTLPLYHFLRDYVMALLAEKQR